MACAIQASPRTTESAAAADFADGREAEPCAAWRRKERVEDTSSLRQSGKWRITKRGERGPRDQGKRRHLELLEDVCYLGPARRGYKAEAQHPTAKGLDS